MKLGNVGDVKSRDWMMNQSKLDNSKRAQAAVSMRVREIKKPENKSERGFIVDLGYVPDVGRIDQMMKQRKPESSKIA